MTQAKDLAEDRLSMFSELCDNSDDQFQRLSAVNGWSSLAVIVYTSPPTTSLASAGHQRFGEN